MMKAPTLQPRSWREMFFLVSVWFKGLDGFLEVVAGIALFTLSPALVLGLVREIPYQHFSKDPRDHIAGALLSAASNLSPSTDHFIAFYLLVHGAVKLVLVWGLLRRVLFIYPLSMAIFLVFIAYQLYRFNFTHSAALLALSALDAFVIVLVYLEYKALLRRTGELQNSTLTYRL
jgi:uncharacterized membrane protein